MGKGRHVKKGCVVCVCCMNWMHGRRKILRVLCNVRKENVNICPLDSREERVILSLYLKQASVFTKWNTAWMRHVPESRNDNGPRQIHKLVGRAHTFKDGLQRQSVFGKKLLSFICALYVRALLVPGCFFSSLHLLNRPLTKSHTAIRIKPFVAPDEAACLLKNFPPVMSLSG